MGICNAPAMFQRAMNMTFQNFVIKTRLTQGMINFCVIVYMDDVLVYSETYHGHAQHIEWTLGALRDAGFKIALEKSEFFLSEISFLGYVVTRGGLRPDSRKVAAVKEAPVPTSLTQVRAFLGLVSYYRRFIKGFAAIARPLTNLLRKDQPFSWDAEHPTAEQLAVIREEEEEEESTGSDEDDDGLEEGGNSGEELGEEDETPEEGSYSEHSEGEQSEGEEESEEGEEEHDAEPAGPEWEAVPEEALRTGTEAEDSEAARKREEIPAGKKELEFASAASLRTLDDPSQDPEPPRPEDGDLTATTPTPSARRRSRSPSSSTRPPFRRRTDTGDRSSSPITLSLSP
ncbi:hypothetical protein CBR_g50424 [Chara braunii]|uniref:Reverse transcriptase domain-containing protein n=1 Tax=Chara braunii TaxID=69332 RepID=A0A388M6T7_CHABU|nr:hypothetical protein CBR_g50424 [Chara braunii]|eukprot:GBG90246.1 hypothetical protein CBR_g50424 [Chara braunii]